MNKCEMCSLEWRERYQLAVQRFDRQIAIATTVTIIAIILSMSCIIITALCVVKTIKFIDSFEYVEETLIEQDGDGHNIAVIGN